MSTKTSKQLVLEAFDKFHSLEIQTMNLERLAKHIAALSLQVSRGQSCLQYTLIKNVGLLSMAFETTNKVGNTSQETGIICPLGRGIAGMCAKTGKFYLSKGASDSRFDKGVDITTGDEQILCAPLKSLQGKVVGVVELTGKNDGSAGFSRENVKALQLFLNFASALVEREQARKIRRKKQVATTTQVPQVIVTPPTPPTSPVHGSHKTTTPAAHSAKPVVVAFEGTTSTLPTMTLPEVVQLTVEDSLETPTQVPEHTVTPATHSAKPMVVPFEAATSTLPTVTLPLVVNIPAEISAQTEESGPSSSSSAVNQPCSSHEPLAEEPIQRKLRSARLKKALKRPFKAIRKLFKTDIKLSRPSFINVLMPPLLVV